MATQATGYSHQDTGHSLIITWFYGVFFVSSLWAICSCSINMSALSFCWYIYLFFPPPFTWNNFAPFQSWAFCSHWLNVSFFSFLSLTFADTSKSTTTKTRASSSSRIWIVYFLFSIPESCVTISTTLISWRIKTRYYNLFIFYSSPMQS